MPYFLGSKAHSHVRNQKLFYLHHSCIVSKSRFKVKLNLKKQVVKDKTLKRVIAVIAVLDSLVYIHHY